MQAFHLKEHFRKSDPIRIFGYPYLTKEGIMLLATSLSTWIIWIVIGMVIMFVYRPALIPAAIIFGVGIGLGWW